MKPNLLKWTVVIGLLLIIIGLGFSFRFKQEISKGYTPREAEDKVFIINKGESLFEISENLEREGLIKNSWIFILYALLNRKQDKLQAGYYLLNPSLSVREILDKFVSGDIIKKKVTIIEGWNLREIAEYLQKENIFSSAELFEVTGYPPVDYPLAPHFSKDFSSQFEFLKDKPRDITLEGYIFPDTYIVAAEETAEDFVKKALSNFDKKLTPELRMEIAKQGKSIFEIVTMASLLEKEVQTFEDKKIVSGILWKRLKNNIPLQVDATLTYITGKKTTKISKQETQIDSPYNTYKYLGLPKGPIANPGLESIITAVFPQDSEYWYYLSTPEGKTIFSKTLQEHNLAKAKYLK